MPDALFDRLGVAQVVFLTSIQHLPLPLSPEFPHNEHHTAQITGELEMALGHLLAVRHNDSASLPRCKVSD